MLMRSVLEKKALFKKEIDNEVWLSIDMLSLTICIYFILANPFDYEHEDKKLYELCHTNLKKMIIPIISNLDHFEVTWFHNKFKAQIEP